MTTNEAPTQPSSPAQSLERIAESLEGIFLFLQILVGDQEENAVVMTQNGPVELR